MTEAYGFDERGVKRIIAAVREVEQGAGPGFHRRRFKTPQEPGGISWQIKRIAASDSSTYDKNNADVVCDGTADEEDFCSLLGGTTPATTYPNESVTPIIGCVRLQVARGNYYFSKSVVLPMFCELVYVSSGGSCPVNYVAIQPESGATIYAAIDASKSVWAALLGDSGKFKIVANGSDRFTSGIVASSREAVSNSMRGDGNLYVRYWEVDVNSYGFFLSGMGRVSLDAVTVTTATRGVYVGNSAYLLISKSTLTGPGAGGLAGIQTSHGGILQLWDTDVTQYASGYGATLWSDIFTVNSCSFDNNQNGFYAVPGNCLFGSVHNSQANNNTGTGWATSCHVFYMSQPNASGNGTNFNCSNVITFDTGWPVGDRGSGLYGWLSDGTNSGKDCTTYDYSSGGVLYTLVNFPGGLSKSFRR